MSHQVRFAWELPEALLAGITQGKGNIVEAVKHAAVLAGVRMKQVFGRKGAELLGLTSREVLALMAAYKIPTLDSEAGWLEKELNALPKRQ
jgi:hypothetical protein